jgi:hypothetical protein
MTLEKVLYTTKVRTTGSWKDIFMKYPLLRLVFVSLLAAQATPSTVWAQVQAAPPISGGTPRRGWLEHSRPRKKWLWHTRSIHDGETARNLSTEGKTSLLFSGANGLKNSTTG